MQQKTMNNARAFRGSDLIRNQQHTDLVYGFADLLDPQGWNIVVSDADIDGTQMRLQMLFKIIGKEEPIEGFLTIPYFIYKNILNSFTLGDSNVH